jgi:hypothetical protein
VSNNHCCGFSGAPKVKKSCCENDAKNHWVVGSGEFDPTNPFEGWTPPTGATQDTTVAVKFGQTLAFFTWTGQVWILDYTFEIPPPISIQPSFIEEVLYNGSFFTFNGIGGAFSGVVQLPKKWCGRITDNQNGTYTVVPYNNNSPNYFGNITVTSGMPGLYEITTSESLDEVNEIVYTGSSNFQITTSIDSPNTFTISLGSLTLLDNNHLCFEFFYYN